MYAWFTENVPGNRHGPTQGNEEEKKSQFHIMALINLLFIQITGTALFFKSVRTFLILLKNALVPGMGPMRYELCLLHENLHPVHSELYLTTLICSIN